jgi:hypothetical protein
MIRAAIETLGCLRVSTVLVVNGKNNSHSALRKGQRAGRTESRGQTGQRTVAARPKEDGTNCHIAKMEACEMTLLGRREDNCYGRGEATYIQVEHRPYKN